MKIRQWLGYNEESSQYLLRAGELRAQINLQSRRPGMLISRAGLSKIFGSYSEEPIVGLYRKDTPYGQPDVFLLFQQVEVDRVLTEAQWAANQSPRQKVWLVSRLTMGYPMEVRAISQQPLSPGGVTLIENMAVAEDRFGRIYTFFGHGAKPIMYRPDDINNTAVEMGLPAPLAQPLVVPRGEGYFLERVDIEDGGGGYWGPPTITIDGGDPERPAKVKAIVQGGNITGVEVIDGGSNYKSTPRLLVGTDKMGAGFRGVGVRETDPGVQGFRETSAGVVSGTGHLLPDETYAASRLLLEPKILYVSSPVAATTISTPAAGASTNQMVVDSIANIQVGDFVTVRGNTLPTGFSSSTSLIRVTDINTSTRTLTLSKNWTPTAGATYQVLLQRNTTLEEKSASYNSTTNRYTVGLPVRTLTGSGRGAEAMIRMVPSGTGYALGPITRRGHTTPTGGPETSRFAYSSVGWDVYTLKGPYYWASSSQEQPNAANASVYAGLQASGSTVVYGYTGVVGAAQGYRQSVDRRADVYWPDYSQISVWFLVGPRGGAGGSGQFVRGDVAVQGIGTSQPYILVTLRPNLPRIRRVIEKGGRRQVVYVPNAPEGARPPVVRINLKNCPDEWITNAADGFNRPTSVKEGSVNRLQWWNAAATTPRPLVDFRGAQDGVALDWGTVEIIDEGSGWREGTDFVIRISQANPYTQTVDYNFATKPLKRKGSHARFLNGNRYVQFAFRATKPDAGPAFGPPARLDGDQFVDISGNDYRSGDVGCVTLGRRMEYADEAVTTATFTGYLYDNGQANEFVFDTVSPTGTYAVAGTTLTVTLTSHSLTIGDRVTLTISTGNGRSGSYIVTGIPTLNTFTVTHPVAVTTSGSCIIAITNRQRIGARIQRVGGDALTPSVRTRDLVTCLTPNVLFEFNQLLHIDTAADVIGLDKMCYPRSSLAGTSTAAASTANNVGSTTTLLFSSPAPDFVVVGQQLFDTGATLSSTTFTITAVTQEANGDLTATVDTTAAITGTATLRPLFTFTISTGLREAQTIRWTATSVSNGDGTQRVTGVRILSGGRNYQGMPTLYSRGGGTGYGFAARGNVQGGQITSVTVLDTGRLYTADPEVYTLSQPAVATPVMRPSLRGTYRCAYRFADRSDTVVATVTLVQVRGQAPEICLLSATDAEKVKPGMVFEGPSVPWNTMVKSVNGTFVELNRPLTVKGRLLVGTGGTAITSPGSGYAQNEAVTCSLPPNIAGYTLDVALRENGSGSYSVESVSIASVANNATLLDPAEYPLTFSPPAAGGETARGVAFPLTPDTTNGADIVTVRDMSRPVAYSDFSPIVDVNAGPTEDREHASEIEWSFAGITVPERADLVEFYRTSSDQSLVFYRLEAYGIPSNNGIAVVGKDTLTDEELFDPDRPFYGAVPVVLPNGSLNAYRFGQPRTDMSVCVAFQDRLWYGVSTSGKDANTLFYSEFDEFESCPDAYELPIQNNQRSTDSLTALVPFGSILLAMQHSHTYAVQYNTDPSVDASIQMMSHRGCLNQRCWDIHDNVLYAADENGIYAMSRTGEVMPLSDSVREWFNGELLDFSKRATFFLNVCNRSRVLRFFCSMASQPTDTPAMALCFHIDLKTWWIERYPNSLCCAVAGRPEVKRINCSVYGATDGNLYETDGLTDVTYRTLMSVNITNHGNGYHEPPVVTCPQSSGVQLQAVVSEGRLVDIIIQSSGWDVWWGVKLLTQNGVELAAQDGSLLDSEEPAPIPLEIGPPATNGTQAVAEGIFSNTTRIVRKCNIVQGTNYVTLLPDVVDLYWSALPISTQDDLLVATQNPVEEVLEIEHTPIEIGMEVFSEGLPPGAVVKSILGPQVFLEFPDGTTVSALDTVSSVNVAFMRKYKAHIPYRLGTGYMELISDSNVTRNGDTLLQRSITVLYTPTETEKNMELIEYYNGSVHARANVMNRFRGGPGGFEHRHDSASTVLNLSKSASDLGAATGVARAVFAGRTNTDAVGGDQHLRVDLLGRIASANTAVDLVPQPFVLHSLTIDGVVDDVQ